MITERRRSFGKDRRRPSLFQTVFKVVTFSLSYTPSPFREVSNEALFSRAAGPHRTRSVSLDEEMAMTRIPRLRRLFALAAVLALTVVPLASARPLESPAAQRAGGDLVSVALKWVEDLVGFRRSSPAAPRQSGQAAPRQDAKSSLGGSCIDPQGRPVPCPR